MHIKLPTPSPPPPPNPNSMTRRTTSSSDHLYSPAAAGSSDARGAPRDHPSTDPDRLLRLMGELASASTSPTAAVLQVVFVDGDRTVDLGTVTVTPSLGVRRLQAVVADRVGVAPHQISASLARPRRPRRVPLDEATDLAAAVAREGAGCFVLAALRRSRRDRRGGRSRRDRKAGGAANPPPSSEMSILKRAPLPPTDLASLAAQPSSFAAWDYEAQLRDLRRQHEWYLINTAAAALPSLLPDRRDGSPPPQPWTPCPECEAAAAAMRAPAFHWCVRDAVTVGFRSPVGPIERPKKTPSPSPSPPPAFRPLPFAHPGLMPPVCY